MRPFDYVTPKFLFASLIFSVISMEKVKVHLQDLFSNFQEEILYLYYQAVLNVREGFDQKDQFII